MNNIYLPEAADFGRSHVKNAENFLDFFIKILPKKPGVPCQARKWQPDILGRLQESFRSQLEKQQGGYHHQHAPDKFRAVFDCRARAEEAPRNACRCDGQRDPPVNRPRHEKYGKERYFITAGKQSGKESFFHLFFMNHL